jgi:hypothetical protein
MSATLSPVTAPTAADLRDGATFVVNGCVVTVDYCATVSDGADGFLVHVLGHCPMRGVVSFKLAEDAPISIIG